MSTAPLVPQRLAWPRPKYILFAVIGVMAVYVLRHNEHFLIDAKDPEWPHIQHFKWWLLPHGLMGACALLLGPMQFSERLRRRFTKFHRVVGRFYVAGVFVAAPLGFYIQHFEERTGSARSFSIAAAVDAILWMLTTGEHAIETIVWGCLAFSLLFADVVLQWQELRRTSPAPARAQTVAGVSAPSAVLSGD